MDADVDVDGLLPLMLPVVLMVEVEVEVEKDMVWSVGGGVGIRSNYRNYEVNGSESWGVMLHPAPKSREMPGGTSHRQSLFAVPVGVGKRLSDGLFKTFIGREGLCQRAHVTFSKSRASMAKESSRHGQKTAQKTFPVNDEQASRPNNLQNSWKWHVSTDKALKSLGSS